MKILYFAWFAEKLGKREEEIEADSNLDSLDKLIELLCARDEEHRKIFSQKNLLKCAVNKRLVEGDTPLCSDDEVAFFPPITGG